MPPDDFITDDEIELLLESLEWFDRQEEDRKVPLRDVFYTLIMKLQALDRRYKSIEEKLAGLENNMMAIYALMRDRKEFH